MKNIIKNLIKRELYIYYFSIPSLIVGWLGLKRIYYSTPDQDFIWIIQSIRFLKGVGPSYNDHPGAYWPLSFLIKFYFLSRNLVFDFIDQYGAVSEEIIKKIISFSRVENCLITASLPLLFFILLKELGIERRIIIISTYCLCLSSAILNLVSDIRHENIGIFFMFLYLIFTSKDLNKGNNLYILKLKSITNTLFFYASIFCKQQILLISPLIFLFIFYVLKIKDFDYFNKFKSFIKRKNFLNLISLFIISGLPWIIISIEEFYQFGALFFLNLPFWCFINTGLILTMMVSTKEKICTSLFLKYLLILTPIQIIVFEIIAPNIWRRSVTAFPAFLFQFTSINSKNFNLLGYISDYINFIQKLSNSLSWPNSIGSLIFLFLVAFFILRLLNTIFFKRTFLKLEDFYFFGLLIISVIFSLRQQKFYHIYIFIPILIMLSIRLDNNNLLKYRTTGIDLLALISSIILLSFTIKSTINLFYLNKFVTNAQSQELMCEPQTLDFSLKHTPAGNCYNFEVEAYKKK